MPVVMKLWGQPTAEGGVRATPYDGWYLKEFDFEANDGRGSIEMTPDIKKAKRFKNGMEAFLFLKRSPEVKPLREDGKPNRPLTATNWEFKPVPWLN